MTLNKAVLGLMCLLFAQSITFSLDENTPELEKAEYMRDFAKIQAKRQSLNPKLDKAAFQKDPDGYMKQVMASRDKNDLAAYQEFADAILNKWASKNPEHFARLTLALCADLTGGTFNDERCYELRRRYALLALEKSDEIPLELEIDLTGRVTTTMIGPSAPKDQVWEQIRRKDVEVRMKTWRRLLDSIDPKWDPNESILSPNAVASELGFPGTVEPQSIKDPHLRAEYEAAIDANRQEIENYVKQNQLHKWLKHYPNRAEEYVIQAYSTPPYNNEELNHYLNDYKIDEVTKARIIDTVTDNINKQTH